MGTPVLIDSLSNNRIKGLVRLQKRNERSRTGLMIIEGVREIARACDGGVEITETFVCRDLIDSDEQRALLERLSSGEGRIAYVSGRVFEKIAYRKHSGGFVSTARRPDFALDAIPVREDGIYCVIDSVEKPGNIGAIMRSADASGVAGVILSNERVELTNPNAIRSSLGAVFVVPCAVASTEETIAWLRDKGIPIITSTPHAEYSYTEANLTASCALVIGNEAKGVAERWIEEADIRVRIPMLGSVDSLNTSSAAAILMYEALRQRSDSKDRSGGT